MHANVAFAGRVISRVPLSPSHSGGQVMTYPMNSSLSL